MTVTAPITLTTNQDLDQARLRAAFGSFPSGVVAVAAEVDGALVGLAASSFTSVSLDPPLVSVSVANTSKTWPDLRRAARLGLTVLAEHHGDVCRQLAGPVAQRFDQVPVTVTDAGAVTLDEGLARFDCSIYREVEAGDHTIVLLLLHAVAHAIDQDDAGSAGAPLVFHRSAFARMAV
ncbi:flavin reductase [Nocardioides immobilis]|uniref:Flavin reductase n=1 Tax=Nocardioides immobilis TaxID=2049295 RepID=A0A417Y5Z6_9ACTN|nr:flavin reductase family protein [Nocardioides immobilis]RHW27904.1 flavin reductase [Nocardioides immobilis]